MGTTSDFKDLFSRQSTDYARFRPTYPDALFKYLASIVEGHSLAWDCGTGNGQAAVKLADYFERVTATDPSAKQLSSAEKHPKVEYLVGSAERTTFSNESVDLITVAQAFHWFNQHEFFAETHRVLKPGGALAFWCYGLARISPEVDAVVLRLYKDRLENYWEPERLLVEEGYKNIQIPFKEITPPLFEMRAEWNLEHLVGYLGTWSALQTYIQKNGSNPLEELFPDLRTAWGATKTRPVTWNLSLRVGKV
jgi:ubiquinone/menaquinone biosynthesis C-methylase UbiE